MKVGIALSGGGIRGIAHLGVLAALDAHGVRIDCISGTSSGAIIGAFYAQGISPKEGFEIYQKIKLSTYIKPVLNLGLLSLDHTEKLYKTYIPHNSFEELKCNLTVAATNFYSGALTYFNSGNLTKAVQASSCIPGVFKPIFIENQMYVDGGVLDNFPIQPLLDQKCDFIIGSNCNHLSILDSKSPKKLSKMIQRSVIMGINRDVPEKKKHCQLFIEPYGLGDISTFELKKAEEVYWIAQEYTHKAIQEYGNLPKSILKS